MSHTRYVTVTDAARNFSDLVNRVYYRGERMILTRNGNPVAFLTPPAPVAKSARELATGWEDQPHLDPVDAARFADELTQARQALPSAEGRWE
jgi:prevent-host-death family protein